MTLSDMAQLTESIRMAHMEMAKMIIDGLRPMIQTGRSTRLAPHDTADDGDVEEDYPGPGVRNRRAPKRREAWENELSVSFALFYLRTGLHQIREKSTTI